MEELDTTPTVTTSQMFLTPEGYTRLHAELENLTVNKRAEIAERLRDSKQHGEFSEDNSELDEVKFEQAIFVCQSWSRRRDTICGSDEAVPPP